MAMQEAFKNDGENAELREENTCDEFSQSKTPAFVVQETQITSAEGSHEVKEDAITVEQLTETNGNKRKKKKKRKKNTNLAFAAETEQGNTNEMTPPVEEANLGENTSSTSETPPVDGREGSCKQPSGSSCGKKKNKKKKKKKIKDVTTSGAVGDDDYDSTVREIAANDVDPVNTVTLGHNLVEEQRVDLMKPQDDVIVEDDGDSQETETVAEAVVVTYIEKKAVDDAVESDNNCGLEYVENKSNDVVELVTDEEEFLASEKNAESCSSQATEVVRTGNVNLDSPACDGQDETRGTEHSDEIEEVKLSDAEDKPNVEIDKEGRNILCIFKLVYGVGLRALRKLFEQIHPTWNNQPSDAAAFDKGTMKLRKEEEVHFKKGDINNWDFSLITSVLRYSKICALEMSKRPGHDHALQELKKIRNELLGHPSTDQMTDADFNIFWPKLCTHFITLGADCTEIANIKLQSDEQLQAGGHYKELFLVENRRLRYVENKLDSIEKKLDTLIESSNDGTTKEPLSPKDLSGAKWDEWLKFCDAVGDFDTMKNQYVLVTDALSEENLDSFSILRSMSWKMVLDFDPMSEEKGMYYKFTSQEGQDNLVSMRTPAELKRITMVNLARQIDPCKTQWLFVNGRSSDTEDNLQEFADWEATSVKEISRFFGCCCDPDKFDKQKPLVCLILPIRKKSVPYVEVTLNRLFENFADQFRLKVVSFRQEKRLTVLEKVKVRSIDLDPSLVHLGLKQRFCSPSTKRYPIPTSQEGVYYDLSEKEYLYLKEHLEILYQGCEELPVSDDSSDDDLKVQKFLDEHRRLFISGNHISFASLYDNHDARREIENDIRIHVQRLLDKRPTRSMIVDIKHSPGTGGTTIARRVMWDLHKFYPCAFVEIRSHIYFDEDNSYANKLADRIGALEEMCHTPPVILIDGKQSRAIESLPNRLVRILGKRGKRALLLRCQHGSKTSSSEIQETLHVHKVFYVDVRLEDSCADLNEFKKKYNDFVVESLDGTPVVSPCRVFHFPLLAMMQEFRPKLKEIIHDTWKEMKSRQQEIAVLVAFLQLYANQSTPALLLADAFKRYIPLKDHKTVTYEDIKQLFTEHLLNLMVPSNPFRRQGTAYQLEGSSPESYTLQHRSVAEMLLKKGCEDEGSDLFQVVNQFLLLPIYQREELMPLFEELFVYNKDGQKKRKFSVLFEKLKGIDQARAAEVFCDAAEKTGDSIVFSNAARFYAKMEPPSFPKAMELIERAFRAGNAKQRFKSLCHTKGVVLYIELQYNVNNGRVHDLRRLEELASKVIDAYKDARNFPPTYPNPLIGEVQVWLACIGWIMKHQCQRDSEKTLKFLANQCPPFFRTCVSDSFCLLDVVDGIVQSVPDLLDPEDTLRRCNNARLSLKTTFLSSLPSNGRGRDAEDVVQACKALCTLKNFPRASILELKRLQAFFILNSSDSGDSIDSLKHENLCFLQTLLEDLVFKENEYRLAYHLMKVCVLVTGRKCYSLERGLAVAEKWLEVSHHDCLPYFYQMAIYFLKILDGGALEFMPKYLKALKACREKSQNHCRNKHSFLFVGKDGVGMSRLITRNTLFRGETDYSTDVPSETVPRFWTFDIRKKLLECKGRIRKWPSSDGEKPNPYIELIQGKVELYVAKSAGIGQVDRGFTQGQLAYFVTSFNLQGPVANGITFEPQDPLSSHSVGTDFARS